MRATQPWGEALGKYPRDSEKSFLEILLESDIVTLLNLPLKELYFEK